MAPPCRLERTGRVWRFLATAVRSQRVSLGSGVSTGKWHHLLVSYDENASDDYELKIILMENSQDFQQSLEVACR